MSGIRASRNMRADAKWRLLVVPLAACQAPHLKAVEPATGYPRQLLAVEGDTERAWVAWDHGTPQEVWLYTGPQGTRYFQIPPEAAPGAHEVVLCNSIGSSQPVQVDVLPAPSSYPPPRIEDVALLALDVAGNDATLVLLTVSAANMDTGATLTVTDQGAGRTHRSRRASSARSSRTTSVDRGA